MTFLLIKSSYCNVAKLNAVAPNVKITDDRTGSAGTSGGSVGTFSPGNTLSEDMINTIDPTDMNSDDDNTVLVYTRDSITDFSANWFSLTEDGTQIVTPQNNIVYIVLSDNQYKGQSFVWDSSTSEYSLKQEIFNDFVFAGDGSNAVQISDYLNLKAGITNTVNSSNIFKNTINFTRTASNIVNGVETGNNKTSFNFGNSGNNNDVLLTYNGKEVATKGYVEDFLNDDIGTGASKNWVKKNFHALAASSTAEYHRLDMSLYYTKTETNNKFALLNSPAFTGIPTSQTPISSDSDRPGQVTSKQIATCDWVYNNYCEIKGETIQSIKNRLTALENA